MKIEYQTGDMLAGPEIVIVHGCNAQGVMGSGVAKAIRDRYPEAFAEYRARYDESGLRVGDVITVVSEERIILDAVTQEFYGRDEGRVYVSYEGLRQAMRAINDLPIVRLSFDDTGVPERVAMPLIGAGLANGRWSIISQIIEEEATRFQPVVYLLDGKIPDYDV